MRRNQMERQDARSLSAIIALILIVLIALSFIALFGWGLLSSLKARLDFRVNMFGLPAKWMFSNYIDAFKLLKVTIATADGASRSVLLPEMILNSLLTSIVPDAVLVLYTALCTYTLAKYKFRGRKLIYNTMIVVMILPIVGSLPAQLAFLKAVGGYDNLLWQWLTAPTVWTGNFLILYAVYKSISWEYAEAALIDGAGHHMIFWKIMVPLSKTTLMVLFILAFIGKWNNYQLTLVYFPSYPTLAYGLFDFQFSKDQGANSITIQLAANILACLPVFAIFIVFREKMMGALTMGGIKG